MRKSIISFTCALTLATFATGHAIAASQMKAPSSVDNCMMMLVALGNKITTAKLKGKALADARSKGQVMAMQCQSQKYAEALATYKSLLTLLATK